MGGTRHTPNRRKILAGTLAELLLPGLRRELDDASGSTPATGLKLRLKRAMVYARIWRAERRNDPAALERALAVYWQSDVTDFFYVAFTERFDRWFHGPHAPLVDALVARAAEAPGFRRLVEIGCGDGRALAHLASRLPGLDELVGLDLNARVIARDLERYREQPKLRFVHADARRWLEGETSAGTILFSYGGVLEYFRESELATIFARLGGCRDTAVALVEPVDPEHDLVHDQHSHPHGYERSFSHNHAALLQAAGFDLRFSRELTVDGVRWVLLLAESRRHA